MSQRLIVAGLACVASVGLAGCESTQSKSARAAKGADADRPEVSSPFAAMNAAEAGPPGDVQVGRLTLLSDEVGTAAVVQLDNRSTKPAYEVPVQLKVTGKDGAEVYTNATTGIQRSLTHAAVVPPGDETFWVNDQIPVAAGLAEGLQATAGAPEGQPPAADVAYTLSTPTLERDPASGFVAKGYLEHDAPEEQRRVLVSVIARKGNKIVAAGRGVVARAKAGKRSRFVVFFIGQPEGADLTATAQPDIDSE